ncbi:MAG: HD domain-containing protein [Thermosipho sp. (in: Bacteria)]|nr:HD domain-containing protein [Thermosipho sp. (in: thermotogales)]
MNLKGNEAFFSFPAMGYFFGEIMFDAKGVPYDLKIVDVNFSFKKLMGLQSKEIIGKSLLNMFSGFDCEFIEKVRISLSQNKIFQDFVYIPKYGKYVFITVVPKDEKFVLISFADMTEVIRYREKMLKLNKIQNTINKVNSVIINANNLEYLYQKICDTLSELDEIVLVFVALFPEKEKQSKIIAIGGQEDTKHYFLTDVKSLFDELGVLSDVVKKRKVVLVKNILENVNFKHYKDSILKIGVKSLLALPLIYEKGLKGALFLLSKNDNVFGDVNVINLIKTLTYDLAIGIEKVKLRKELMEKNKVLEKSIEDILKILSKFVEIKDPYTLGHQINVANLSEQIAIKMGLPENQVRTIRLGALVHDIGKIGVPIEILVKPGKLSEKEFELIKEHPIIGHNLLKDLIYPYNTLAEIALQHHERLNGTGYPNGLKGSDISLESRIIAVADVVEAMSSHRPYRPSLGIEKALDVITKGKGKLFDPEVVNACISLFKEDNFSFSKNLE